MESCGRVNQTTSIRAYEIYDQLYMYEFYVYWGDNTVDYYEFHGTDSPAASDEGRNVNFTHVYEKVGNYAISIRAIGHHDTSGNSPCIEVTQGDRGDWVLKVRQNSCSETGDAAGSSKLNIMAVAAVSLLIGVGLVCYAKYRMISRDEWATREKFCGGKHEISYGQFKSAEVRDYSTGIHA